MKADSRNLFCFTDSHSQVLVIMNQFSSYTKKEEKYGENFILEEKQTSGVHKLTMLARKTLSLTGVKEVISFDTKEVVLATTQGMLVVRGDGLNVNRLLVEHGEVDIEGRVDSMIYSERGKKEEALWKRLFS